MSLSVCVVDDDERSLKDFVETLKRIPELTVLTAETDPVLIVSKILSGVIKTDIVFSDLEMPDLSGIDLCNQIGDRAVVIFVTGHPGFALEAYNTDAADFIVKPVNLKDILRAIQKAKEKLIARNKLMLPASDRCIFVKLSPRNVSRIKLIDLLYIEVDGKYISLYIENQKKPISLKKSLGNIYDQLPPELFMKISKSCVVNMNRVSSIVGNILVLDTGSTHTIGSTFMTEVYEKYDSI
ncbi:LytTR family DNA-binding domain-containing protein [Sphingobacterium sp. DR205]|uniref:LytR/AlgR family response regulator transcription factor n=1 Tax=Sphingobacterium sp. DR205 TaxID=2713573 RepID=UPI0013E4A043|nr:LytTR family DNA-binding domain-containing protein [Sphingobacterium sp. DR205]QIH33495.1 response regulator transcription factor [Sphingobacterium sp. DR205]